MCLTQKKAFQVRCRKAKGNKRKFSKSTVQIYQNCLYAYGTIYDNENGILKDELWSLDISTIYYYFLLFHQNRGYLEVM